MSSRRRVLAIINHKAGTVKRIGVNSVEVTLTAAFADVGIDAEFALHGGADVANDAKRALAAAKAGSIDAVVVGGGDGTVATVAAIFADTKHPVAVLPLGTLNHFAKDIGMPTDLNAAVKTIAGFNTRRVDLAEVNGEVFINNSSIGIYPYIVMERERRRQAGGWSKRFAMILAAFRGLRRFPQRRLLVSAEGTTLVRRTPCLFVGNNAYDPSLLTRDRMSIDAGRLCIYIARPRTPLAFAWLVIRAALGIAVYQRDLDLIDTAAAEVASRTSRLPVALDGEVRVLATPLRYRSRPAALTVIVPAPS